MNNAITGNALSTVSNTLNTAVTAATKTVAALENTVSKVASGAHAGPASTASSTSGGQPAPAPSACGPILYCPVNPANDPAGSLSPYPTGTDAPLGPGTVIPEPTVTMEPNGDILEKFDWNPFNTNVITKYIPVEAPALNAVLPADIAGVVVNRNYAFQNESAAAPTVQERAGEHLIPTGTNDGNWRASSTSIYVPGVTRVATVEFSCPGMGGIDNPNGDYTSQTYIEPSSRTIVLSWEFGDRVVNFFWIYSHYALYSLVGGGGSGHTGTTGSVMGMGNTNPSGSM